MDHHAPAAARRATPTAGFWILGATLFTLMVAAAAPSPLYVVYQREWALTPLELTAVFAVYAVTLLAVLLTAGSLSDHLGRRPVLLAALVLEAGSLGLFLLAGGVGGLLLARGLQGVATGAAMATISAGLVDLQPPGRPVLGSLLNAVAPTAGLAAGALLSGALVEYAPAPTTLVFAVLLAAVALTGAATLVLPEPVRRRPGALASLRPRVTVPAVARPAFLVAAPAFVATWAVGGLYLALGPSLAVGVLGVRSHLVGGVVVAALTGAGAVGAAATIHRPARRVMLGGAGALGLGLVVSLVALVEGSLAGFLAGSAVAGLGFGSGFLGGFRTLAGIVDAARRAELFSAVFVVSYLAFSLPALLAGLTVTRYGLRPTALGYGAVVVLLVVSVPVLDRLHRRQPTRDVPSALPVR